MIRSRFVLASTLLLVAILGSPPVLAVAATDSSGDDPGTCVVNSGDACGHCDTSTCISPGQVLVCETSDSEDACLCNGLPDFCQEYWLTTLTDVPPPPCVMAAQACQSACGHLPDVTGESPQIMGDPPQQGYEVDFCDPPATLLTAQGLAVTYVAFSGRTASQAILTLDSTPTPYPPTADPTGQFQLGGECPPTENAAYCNFTPPPDGCGYVEPGQPCVPGPYVCFLWFDPLSPAPSCVYGLAVEDVRHTVDVNAQYVASHISSATGN